METQTNLKAVLRREIKSRFDKFPRSEYRLCNSQIQSRFFDLPEVIQARQVMIYYSINREVETVPLIEKFLRQGKTVALPACLPGHFLEARQIEDLHHLRKTRFGLLEPLDTEPVISPKALDLIVVPGLAFDAAGGRLGHGMGYYDRFLPQTDHAFKLGLAYDFQIVPQLPISANDVPMDALIAPSGIFYFHRQ